MKRTTTKLVIGDAGDERDMEWGEIYHAAAFLAAKEEHEIEVRFHKKNEKRWMPVVTFLRSLSSEQRVSYSAIEGRELKQSQKIQKSAKVLLSIKDAGTNVEALVREKLLRATGKELLQRDRTKPKSCFLWIRWNRKQDSKKRDLTKSPSTRFALSWEDLESSPFSSDLIQASFQTRMGT
jgi:hypothetical protein